MRDNLIVFYRDVKKASLMLNGEKYLWTYLGSDVKGKKETAALLGDDSRLLIGELLQSEAYRIKDSFMEFVTDIGFNKKNMLNWWALNFASKSPLQGDLFKLYCFEAVIKDMSKKHSSDNLVFIIEDVWFYKYLASNYRKEYTFIGKRSRLPSAFRLALLGVYSGLDICFGMLKNKLFNKKTNNKIPSDIDVFIYSWVEDRFFKQNEIVNPYFGRLSDILNDADIRFTNLTPLHIRSDIRKKCIESGKFIILDSYVGVTDLIKSVFSTIMITCFALLKFSGQSSLLLREIFYEFSNVSFFTNKLTYYAFVNWAKSIGDRKISFIYTFENHPWEKLMCIACKKHSLNTRLVGYQHSTIPQLLLNYFFTEKEGEIMPLPDYIVANGEHYQNVLIEAGYAKRVNVINGGALRYEALHNLKATDDDIDTMYKKVLIIFPSSRVLTEEILLVLIDYCNEFSAQDFEFLLKFHPDTPMKTLQDLLEELPDNFRVSKSPMNEVLAEAGLVIYSSSTSGLEALLAGKKVVKYYSEHAIDLDPLDSFTEVEIRSCFEGNMRDIILSMFNEKDFLCQRKDILNLSKVFSPVREDVWKTVLLNR
ncbi:MAG: hypothetical protein N3I35_12105 [Clostridia bacterium]|nr:hypothetical protein [Clostridia bacterium]